MCFLRVGIYSVVSMFRIESEVHEVNADRQILVHFHNMVESLWLANHIFFRRLARYAH